VTLGGGGGGGGGAVHAPLMHLITFSDSTAALLLLAQFEGLPSKTVERSSAR